MAHSVHSMLSTAHIAAKTPFQKACLMPCLLKHHVMSRSAQHGMQQSWLPPCTWHRTPCASAPCSGLGTACLRRRAPRLARSALSHSRDVCLLTLQCMAVSGMGHLWMVTGVPKSLPSVYRIGPVHVGKLGQA